jgi:hypothetical protein
MIIRASHGQDDRKDPHNRHAKDDRVELEAMMSTIVEMFQVH